MSCASFAHESL